MLAYQSALKTNNYFIIKSCCDLIVPKQEVDPTRVYFAYPLDIDYSIRENEGETGFRVLMDIKINYPSKDPGYSILVEAMGDFEIDSKRDLTEPEKEHLINYMAVEHCIDFIRGYIISLTSYYPLGRYMFDKVDMNKLYQSKLQQRKKIKTTSGKLYKQQK